ncbi:MAG: glucose 1-dehydrogenase [Leptospiraceae bacterium]|nr:glucose 1-dehydrogenase [Leptospiraceae bacterium]
MINEFQNKAAIITGGTSGLGKAIVSQLIEVGCNVVFCGRNEVEGNNLSKLLSQKFLLSESFGKNIFVKCDVSKNIEVENLVNQSLINFGKLDYLVNNAAILGGMAKTQNYDENQFEEVFQINVKGTWLCIKNSISEIIKTKGCIVNISSTAGIVGVPYGIAPYSASKHAIIGLTKSIALEYAKEGIRVNAIAPGAIDTEGMNKRYNQTENPEETRKINAKSYPSGRIATPIEVAKAVIWLLGDESSFINGAVIPIDGGKTAQ